MTLFRAKPKIPVHELVARQRAVVLGDWRSWVLPVVVALGPLGYVVIDIGVEGSYFTLVASSFLGASHEMFLATSLAMVVSSVAAARWKSRWLLRWNRVRDLRATPMRPDEITALLEAGFLLPWMIANAAMVLFGWMLTGLVLRSSTELRLEDCLELTWLAVVSSSFACLYVCLVWMNRALAWDEILRKKGGIVATVRWLRFQWGSAFGVMALIATGFLAMEQLSGLDLFKSAVVRLVSVELLVLLLILVVSGVSLFAERRLAVRLREKLESESDTGG